MTAVLLACTSAVLFGAMTVAIRLALGRGVDAGSGALATVVVALGVAAAAALAAGLAGGGLDLARAWPFALAGLLAPGGSQLAFTLAVRDAGPSRSSIVVGMAPLAAIAIALVFLDEPFDPLRIVAAVLVVAGGVALLGERERPAHFRLVGLAYAAGAAVLIATRDNLLRWLSADSGVSPLVAATAALAAGTLLVTAYLVATRGRVALVAAPRAARAFWPAGVLFGLSYVALFEAYYHGRVTLVSPLVATESLWGVACAALVMRSADLVGRRLVVGAALVVAGGVLIGISG